MGRHQKHGRYADTVQRHGRHAGTVVVALAVIFCLVVLGTAIYIVYAGSRQPEVRYPQLEPDGNIQIGTLSNPEGRQAELDAIVQEGMLTFAINATPSMKNGASEANLMIENPPSNGSRFTVTITRDDTGEEIYKSGYLDPEQYIENTRLDVELPAGEYSCTAWLDVYRIDDNAYIGRMAAQMKLYVQS